MYSIDQRRASSNSVKEEEFALQPPRGESESSWYVIGFVCVLGFLLASFPARNLDVWKHLAAGRHLASGATEFSPTWAFDLASYFLFRSWLSATGVVLCKAILAAGLAWVLFSLSRKGSGSWWPSVCTILALLTISMRLLVQPTTVSFLLFALALLLLHRIDQQGSRGNRYSLGLLLGLFLVWANTDTWFVLGYCVVALVLIGRIFDRTATIIQSSGTLLCLAVVCLINPHHIHAFSLPAPLAALTLGQITSPFERNYFAGFGLSPAGMAYFPLLGLGLISFLVNRRRWRWERFFPWLALAVLSALQVRIIPFFAVVAGPVTAWNLQEALTLSVSDAPNKKPRTPWRRRLAIGLGVALLICAWPGWLQVPPYEPRSWRFDMPPSLERAAAVVRGWREEGVIPANARGLHLSPESIHVFAWFCPEDQGLLDSRVTNALVGENQDQFAWPGVLRAANVDHVIVHSTDRTLLGAALNQLLVDPAQWRLLHLEGDVSIFGWRDPASPTGQDRFADSGLDLKQLMIHPPLEEQALRTVVELEPRSWWEAFWKPALPRTMDRDTASMYLLHAEVLRRSAGVRHLLMWNAIQAGGLVGCGTLQSGPGSLLGVQFRLALLSPWDLPRGGTLEDLPSLARATIAIRQGFIFASDDLPPELLYLSIRAARRALAVNPHDAQTYLVLGQCYLRLLGATRERAWSGQFPQLVDLRQTQASAALNEAVRINPNLPQAHLGLAQLYQQLGYLDLALKHVHRYQQLTLQPRLEQDPLEAEVEKRVDSYSKEAVGANVYNRARLALNYGLAGKALDLLLESDVAAFGSQGMALELELLLRTGRIKEVHQWMEPDQKRVLGATTFHWLRARQLAASGEYLPAKEELLLMSRQVSRGEGDDKGNATRGYIAWLVAMAILDEQQAVDPFIGLLIRAHRRTEFKNRIEENVHVIRQSADLDVLRGLLALEEGQVGEAALALRSALGPWQNDDSAAISSKIDFNGRAAAQNYLKWLQ